MGRLNLIPRQENSLTTSLPTITVVPQPTESLSNDTTINLAQTSALPASSTVKAATVSETPKPNQSPSGPSQHQLGVAIGASVGVPIGLLIILAMVMTCVWQWKRRTGPIGRHASRRAEERAAKDKAAGGRDEESDLVGYGKKNTKAELPPPLSQRARIKGVDIFAASLAAKSSVAAKEAMADAEKLSERRKLSETPSSAATRQKRTRFEGSLSAFLKSRASTTRTVSDSNKNQFNSDLSSKEDWSVRSESTKAQEGRHNLGSSIPIHPLRSKPPNTFMDDESTHTRPATAPAPQRYPSYSRPLRPQSQQANIPLRTPSNRQLTTHHEDPHNWPDGAIGISTDDVSALPPMPNQIDNPEPRKTRSHPLLQSPTALMKTKTKSKRPDIKSNPPQSPQEERLNSPSSSYSNLFGRSASVDSSYRQSPSTATPYTWSSRPTSPSVTDSLPRTSPAFHVQAELQRRAQQQSLWEQRRMIGESYGRLMRDWDAGPVRRMGDGRDFVGGGTGGLGGFTHAGNDTSGPSGSIGPIARAPKLRGPGSRESMNGGERRPSTGGNNPYS